MKLDRILHRNANNLDIFRVLAASMVIINHAYALVPEAGYSDWTRRTLGFDSTGTLAVKIFFFLSGLVVTNSLLSKQRPFSFVIARFCRIWPALTLVVVVSALILGPVFSTLPIHDYFNQRQVYHYVYDNLALNINYLLPGIFTQNAYKNTVNGSLWTIPYEVSAYAALFALFIMGLLKKTKLVHTLLFALLLLDPLTGNTLLLTWLPPRPEITLLMPCFAFGALLAIYKEEVQINAYVILGAWILSYLFRLSSCNVYFFYFALFSTLLYLSAQTWMLKLKPKADISYGMYLWGFPVQQVMAQWFGNYGVRFNQFASLTTCIVLGLFSWHFVEKRFILLGSQFGRSKSDSGSHQSSPP